ncbi:c-type cytochrome biogenesis protein CcmI [Acetobacter fallax]|uniref:C-type cytochrome biogenesis protein CcmI n=1 Tax=Acetobacter fallax TaxID=1737473 RepID=A0ABX0KFG7_9PROT|nr:c-type cytochrome biogenesis protein CcmI [Acetobacter fallax]NHO32672.1 c-type cytochrome biogenesis protein CcmI [Acetobacter fallax]NHO36268.1 c-type cytochrome biogenesis protein CcmI [Acetobacter fallax]
MIWLSIACLSVFALLPAAFALWRRAVARDERSAALELHEAQLVELDRDLSSGMIALSEHSVAQLEIQRRILVADRAPAEMADRAARNRVFIALALVPLVAVGLYLTGGGHPGFPAQPLAPRLEAVHAHDEKAGKAIDQLKQTLSVLPPGDPSIRQGYLLLGQAEASRGHDADAAVAWRKALDLEFAPELALQVAEEQVRSQGRISADSLALYRRALDAAPKDAPWRQAVQQRIAQGEHDQEQP